MVHVGDCVVAKFDEHTVRGAQVTAIDQETHKVQVESFTRPVMYGWIPENKVEASDYTRLDNLGLIHR